MKTLLFFLILSVAFQFSAQAQTDSTVKSNRAIFTVVEQQPEFPGGMRKLVDYLSNNLHYPEEARKAGLEGRVFIRFIVTYEGRVENVTVLKKLGLGTDEEAVRLVASMPNWRPGKQSGRAVDVVYNLPINFSLK